MKSQVWLTRFMIGAVTFSLCGVPEAAMAAQNPTPTQSSQTGGSVDQQQQPAQHPLGSQPAPVTILDVPQQQQQPAQGTSVDPSQGPLTPVPSQTLPEAPSSTQQGAQQPSSTPATGQQQPTNREPLGAAAAEGIRTTGGGASRPAGAAIAPAKQRQVRSFLIKLGAIAAAGAAIGTVYALSRGTSSTPPGTR
jgi:hypothetical protein